MGRLFDLFINHDGRFLEFGRPRDRVPSPIHTNFLFLFL